MVMVMVMSSYHTWMNDLYSNSHSHSHSYSYSYSYSHSISIQFLILISFPQSNSMELLCPLVPSLILTAPETIWKEPKALQRVISISIHSMAQKTFLASMFRTVPSSSLTHWKQDYLHILLRNNSVLPLENLVSCSLIARLPSVADFHLNESFSNPHSSFTVLN